MTFLFQPHRPSSEDDEIDQQLNHWVSGSDTEPANDLSADALEFHRWASETRRSDPAATGPAAGTYNRILHKFAQESPKGVGEMSTATLSAQSPGFSVVPRETARQSIRHYTSLAATIALVLAVAVGGWLAMSQMPGGRGEGHFAALQGTPDVAQSQTCDVEPMTVDEVMGIVNNPYHYMDEDDYPVPLGAIMNQTPWLDDYQEVQPRLPVSLNTGLDNEPTQTAFDQASVVISQYVECLQTDDTVAMMLRFSDPFSIQHHVFAEFPIYRTEDQVRNYVTDWLGSGDIYHALTYERPGGTLTYRPAKEKALAGTQLHDFGLGFDQVIYVGSEIYDENGNLVGNFHPGIYMTYNVDPEFLAHGVVFTLLHSRYTGHWYIVSDGWMNLDSVI